MALPDDLAALSEEVTRWLDEELTTEQYTVVGTFIQWMLAHDAAPDDRVVVPLGDDVRLRALIVPRGGQTWALTFYVGEAQRVVMLTVHQVTGGRHPEKQVARARAQMERAQRAGDDPSVLVPGQ
jgi:hypothetical protein